MTIVLPYFLVKFMTMENNNNVIVASIVILQIYKKKLLELEEDMALYLEIVKRFIEYVGIERPINLTTSKGNE